jgi:hypothetical protein
MLPPFEGPVPCRPPKTQLPHGACWLPLGLQGPVVVGVVVVVVVVVLLLLLWAHRKGHRNMTGLHRPHHFLELARKSALPTKFRLARANWAR